MADDDAWAEQALSALAGKAKPPGSLGMLEEWAVALCVAQKTLTPGASRAEALIFVADHGAKKADAALSPFPPSVTESLFRGLASGKTAGAVLTRSVGAHLTVVDVGIDADVADVEVVCSRPTAAARASCFRPSWLRCIPSNMVSAHTRTVLHCKVGWGSLDLRLGAAMTPEMLEAALAVGRRAVLDARAARSVQVLAIGEAGIGNTTAASALLAALTGAEPSACCGRGTGLDDAGVAHKVATVTAALQLHCRVATGVDTVPPMELLRRLGGLEIAAMAGAFLAAHECGCVALIDGFISGVAALAAARIDPACRRCLLFADGSNEAGAPVLAAALGARPALDMGLCLGEATGALLAVPLVRAAAEMMCRMETLKEVFALQRPPA